MENERKFLWSDVDKRIVCPRTPTECKIKEGIKRYPNQISHTAVFYTSECLSCESKGAVLGFPDDQPE